MRFTETAQSFQPLSAALIEDEGDELEENTIQEPNVQKVIEQIVYKEILKGRSNFLREKGYTQKAVVGSHKVYLRTENMVMEN